MSTKTKRLRILKEIYATIPTVECKGLCYQSCAVIPVYDVELQALEHRVNHPLPLMDMETSDGTRVMAIDGLTRPDCPLLVMRRCSQYDARPFVCRIFGVADGMPCPHGCQPVKPMTDPEVRKIQERIAKL